MADSFPTEIQTEPLAYGAFKVKGAGIVDGTKRMIYGMPVLPAGKPGAVVLPRLGPHGIQNPAIENWRPSDDAELPEPLTALLIEAIANYGAVVRRIVWSDLACCLIAADEGALAESDEFLALCYIAARRYMEEVSLDRVSGSMMQ